MSPTKSEEKAEKESEKSEKEARPRIAGPPGQEQKQPIMIATRRPPEEINDPLPVELYRQYRKEGYNTELGRGKRFPRR